MRGFLKVLLVLTCLVLLPSAVFAQGTIAGVVRDASGAALRSVTVQAASPALIERVRETVTDGSGQFRLVDLRPGIYTVTASLAGFNKFERADLEVSGTATITVNAEMKIGEISETITVSGERPVVELQSTTQERVMSKEVIDALPTGRMYFSLGVLVPGVNSSSSDVGGSLGDTMGSLTAHGSTGGDQRILQNGLNVMTLQTGGGNIGVPNTAAAEEVAIDTSAAPAERQTGGVSVNFIPRDGGNTLRGSLFATAASEGQQASNYTQRLIDEGLAVPAKFRENWDINPGIGGPLLQDKLWYYYTYRNNGARQYSAGMFYNRNEFIPNNFTYAPANGSNGTVARPALGVRANWWDSQIRLTWRMNPKNKFAGTWDQQYRCECPNGISATTSPEAGNDRRFPTQRLLHAEWWSPLTSRILMEFVALHRTEDWGNTELRPASQDGSLDVTPAQYALYPKMIGVTQQAGAFANNLAFHGPAGTFNNARASDYTYRWAVSYITGAHVFKVGGQDSTGSRGATTYMTTLDTLNRPVRYQFSNANAPNQVTAYHTPYTINDELAHDFGFFVQDRWTRKQLTVNLGVRYDWFSNGYPAQTLGASTLGRPATSFAAEDNLNWKDVTPRLGAAYDLLGDGKTAIKVSLNKYVAGQGLGGLASNTNPIGRLVNSVSRTWNDTFFPVGDARRGNFVVDCNLSSTAANSECAALTGNNLNFGTFNATQITDSALRQGWNVRSYNWEFSAGVQRELMRRVSLDVSFFRRWFGNFTVSDNVSTVAADYTRFRINAPFDDRLPLGGGYGIDGFYDSKLTGPATLAGVNQSVLSSKFGDQISHWNGVDVNVSARLQNGLLLQGGTSTGRTATNNCDIVKAVPESLGNNPDSFCDATTPFLTQFKLVGAYALPRYGSLPGLMATVLNNVQLAATLQSIPGASMAMTYAMPNSELSNPAFSTLGRSLQNGTTKTVALLNDSAGQVYGDRLNQLDLRVGKLLRFGRTRTALNFDVFNVFNTDTVLTRNNALTKVAGFGARNTAIQADGLAHTVWVPTENIQARFFKLSVNFDF